MNPELWIEGWLWGAVGFLSSVKDLVAPDISHFYDSLSAKQIPPENVTAFTQALRSHLGPEVLIAYAEEFSQDEDSLREALVVVDGLSDLLY